MKILGICGSTRSDSLNKKLLALALKEAQERGHEISVLDLKELALPLYDGDLEASGLPESAKTLKRSIENADCIFIASPEHNYSISAALKNAIDWSSRQGNAWDGKIAAIFGVSDGAFGTVRGQFHLRHILTSLNVLALPQPQVLVRFGTEAFTADGQLKDEKTKAILARLVEKTLEIGIKINT